MIESESVDIGWCRASESSYLFHQVRSLSKERNTLMDVTCWSMLYRQWFLQPFPPVLLLMPWEFRIIMLDRVFFVTIDWNAFLRLGTRETAFSCTSGSSPGQQSIDLFFDLENFGMPSSKFFTTTTANVFHYRPIVRSVHLSVNQRIQWTPKSHRKGNHAKPV